MCQITVADWVEPMGSLLFLNFLNPSRHTRRFTNCAVAASSLRRVQNCDQTFFRRRQRCVCVCVCSGFPPRCHRDSRHTIQLSTLKSFLSHCTYVMWVCELHYLSVCSCSGLFFFFFGGHTLCSNTRSTHDNLKRMAYRKKNSKYI